MNTHNFVQNTTVYNQTNRVHTGTFDMSRPAQTHQQPFITQNQAQDVRPRYNTTGAIMNPYQNSTGNATLHNQGRADPPKVGNGWVMNHDPWVGVHPQKAANQHNSHNQHHQNNHNHHQHHTNHHHTNHHHQHTNNHHHNSRLLAIDEREVAIARLQLQADRLETRVLQLEARVAEAAAAIELAVGRLQKEEAFFQLGRKKEANASLTYARALKLAAEQQVWALEHGAGDDAYLQVVKDSNELLEKLTQQIDTEAVEQAKKLQLEGKMRREEIEDLLQSEDNVDQELLKEIDEIELSIYKQSQANLSTGPIKLGPEVSVEKLQAPTETIMAEIKDKSSIENKQSSEIDIRKSLKDPSIKDELIQSITSKVTSELICQ